MRKREMKSTKRTKILKIGKRLFALGLAGMLLLPGTVASAKQNYKKSYKADTGVTYYDIYDGSTSKRGTDETDDAIAAVTHNGALKAWAQVACSVIGSSTQYFYQYKKTGFDVSFGKDAQYIDLESALGNSGRNLAADKDCPCPFKTYQRYANMNQHKDVEERNKGDANIGDNVWRTGLQVANSRKSAMDAMMQVIPDIRAGNMKADKMLERNYIPQLDNSDKDTVLYTFVGCNQRYGGELKYEYNVLGLVFYDFQYCPIPDDEVVYYTDDTNKVMESPSKYVTDTGLSSTMDGLQYFRSMDSNLDISSLDNSKSSTPSTLTLQKSEGTTSSVTNTFNKSETISYGQSISEAFRIGKQTDPLGHTLTFGFTFSEAYQTAFSNSETAGTSENKSSTATYQVPAYSIMSVAQDTTKQEVELDYENAVAMSYKVAVVGINGTYYCDATFVDITSSRYSQNQLCAIFGNVNRKGESVASTEDAITNMVNRQKKAKKDGNNANEENYYMLATNKYSKSKHESNVKDNKTDGWLSKTPVLDWSKMKNMDEYCTTMDKNHHVMNVAGAKIKGTETVTKYTVLDPALCKPLNQTKAYTDDNLRTAVSSKNISVDSSINLSDYSVAGFFKDGTKFPLDSTKGTWVMVDDNGKEIGDSDVATLQKNAGKNLVLKPKKTGTVNLMYKIDEGDNAYYYIDTNNGNKNTKITNDSLQSMAMIEVNIHSNAASAAAASLFSGENKAGAAAIIIVLVLIVAGTIFVIVRKRKKLS